MLYRDAETSRLLAGERVGDLAGDRRGIARRRAADDGAAVARRLGMSPEVVRRLSERGFLGGLALSDDQIRRRLFGAMWRDAMHRTGPLAVLLVVVAVILVGAASA